MLTNIFIAKQQNKYYNIIYLRNVLMICFLLFFGIRLSCQDRIEIKRITGTVTFDGKPFEKVWDDMVPFSLKMSSPSYGMEPSEKSEIFIGYDDNYLWIGARLYSRDSRQIISTSKKRDETAKNSDALGIILDTYNDNENALAFVVLPTSARIDYTIFNDAEMVGGAASPGSPPVMPTNISWNTFWDVKTSIDNKGWYVEMRIPFSSLRFQPVNDIVKMGLIINRSISYNNEIDTYPPIDPKYGMNASIKPSRGADIEIKGIKSSRPLYFSPYFLTGYTREFNLNEDSTLYIRKNKPEFNIGGDLKYSITSNFTLDLTANTDFAQVEADDQQVNLTRFSLFFPEKRMFFQERSSLFSFNLGGNSDLFFSRNIGIANEEPVKIYGGARLTGHAGKWEMGMIDMQTAKHDTTPSENFGVLRFRRQIINSNSFVGGIFTSRIGMHGDRNYAYGLDGIFKLYGEDFMSIRVAQSYDRDSSNRINSIKPGFLFVNWERRSQKGLGYNLAYTYSGEQFNPGIGFIQRPSIQGFTGNLAYNWMPGEKSKFFNYGFQLTGTNYISVSDGKPQTTIVSPEWQMQTKGGYMMFCNLMIDKEGVSDDFSISDSVSIKKGVYTFHNAMAGFMTPMSKPISVFLAINGGGYYDGNQIGVSVMPSLNFSSSFQVSGSYTFTHLNFPDRISNRTLNIHITNIKALYMFSTKLSASILVQYVNTDKDMITNFRLRYNPSEGNDLYLVLNEYRGISNVKETPVYPVYFQRSVMLKYTHTFKL